MSFNSYVTPRTLLAGVAILVAGAAVWLAVGAGGASADSQQAASPSAGRALAAARRLWNQNTGGRYGDTSQ